MSLGFLLLIMWIFVFDMDIIAGIIMLVISGWFGGGVDAIIVEKIVTPNEQVIKVDQPVIQTETLSSKETCESNDGVWVDSQKACY